MLYTKSLTAAEKSNNFTKSFAASDAVLRLVANLGTVRLSEVVRVFRPQDEAWHAEVLARAKGYLAFLYALDDRARKQFQPTADVLDALGAVPVLGSSAEKKLRKSGTPMSLVGAEATVLVDLESGLKSTRIKRAALPVLRVHWLRARSLAIDVADKSASGRAGRTLERLVSDGLLSVQRGELADKLYSLSSLGAVALGDRYRNTDGRSLMQSEHKTMANGYLLHALCTATDGWSEGSLFSGRGLPGVLGTGGMLTHADLYTGSATGNRSKSSSMHPADGLLLTLVNRTLTREAWDVELVEVERGSKASSEFVRSLYPLESGKNPLAKIANTYTRLDKSVLVREFSIRKITYVMHSEEFLTPLLKACYQFITGMKEDKNGQLNKVATLRFTGSGSWTGDRAQAQWEELLSMVAVALCPLSAFKKNFLGVTFKGALLDIATERGLLDMKKLYK